VFFVSLNAAGLESASGQVRRQAFMYRITMAGDQIANLLVLWDERSGDKRLARTHTR
jgi:hypothetical protein